MRRDFLKIVLMAFGQTPNVLRPFDVHAIALSDLLSLPDYEWPYVRYLALDSVENVKVVSFVLNWLSNAPVVWKPPVLALGPPVNGGPSGPCLVRVDLRRYAPRVAQMKRWARTWEELAFDPDYNVLVTKDALELLAKGEHLPFGVKEVNQDNGKLLVKTKPYTHTDGNRYEYRWVDVLRLPARHVDQRALAGLEERTISLAPVVRWTYFTLRALSSIRDKGVFKDVFGGLYYEFVGLRRAKDDGRKGVTDLDLLLEDLGVIDDASKTKFQEKLDRLDAEQRVAMVRSEVTGKVRAVYFFQVQRNPRRRAMVFLTQDVKDQEVDLSKNVFANLLALQPDAMEVIWVDSNGSQKYALFNGQGELQDEVPPDIANDNTVPHPYTQRLQTTGCIVCHGAKGNDGWMPAPNQVYEIAKALPGRKGLGRLNIQDDLSRLRGKKYAELSREEVLSLIEGKYAGNADGTLADLRRGLISSVLEMTGPYRDDKTPQLEVYKRTAEAVGRLRDDYWYKLVTPEVALEEIYRILRGGGRPTAAKGVSAAGQLGALLPADPSAAATADDYHQFVEEDLTLGQLKAGIGVGRAHWELKKGFALGRAKQVLDAQDRAKKK
jgi:hypothetical protein